MGKCHDCGAEDSTINIYGLCRQCKIVESQKRTADETIRIRRLEEDRLELERSRVTLESTSSIDQQDCSENKGDVSERHQEIMEAIQQLTETVSGLSSDLLNVVHALNKITAKIDHQVDRESDQNALPTVSFYQTLFQWCNKNKTPRNIALIASSSLQVRVICRALRDAFHEIPLIDPDSSPGDIAGALTGISADDFIIFSEPEYWVPKVSEVLHEAYNRSSISIEIDQGINPRTVQLNISNAFRGLFVTCDVKYLHSETVIVWPQSDNNQKMDASKE
jgi:hypothetical protein